MGEVECEARLWETRLVLPNTVLLVDDDSVVLDVLAIALRKKQLVVKTARRLREALAMVKAEPFGCLMADKNLEDGSGLELIEKMRQLQPDCACVMMTGYPNAESILAALRLGAVDYLEKPFPNLAIIQEKIIGLITRQRVMASHAQAAKKAESTQDFGGQTQVAMLQHAIDVMKEDHLKALAASHHDANQLSERLDAIKFRHQQSITALRRVAAALANLLEGHHVLGPMEQELREVRRLVTTVLEER